MDVVTEGKKELVETVASMVVNMYMDVKFYIGEECALVDQMNLYVELYQVYCNMKVVDIVFLDTYSQCSLAPMPLRHPIFLCSMILALLFVKQLSL